MLVLNGWKRPHGVLDISSSTSRFAISAVLHRKNSRSPGIMFVNPTLDEFLEIDDLREKFICFSFTHNASCLITQLVSLPPASIEVGCCSSRARAHGKLKRSKCGLVRSLALYAVTGTSDGDLRQKEACFIS